MTCNLIMTTKKVKKDEKEFKVEEFYLELENGKRIRIQPNEFIDSEGEKRSTKHDLSILATLVK